MKIVSFMYNTGMKKENVQISNKEELIKVMQKNHIVFAAVFGSRAKGMAKPDSDYDFLVEFDPKAHITYFDLYDIEENIKQHLSSPIDLITTKGTNKRLHEEIDKTMVVLYDKRK